MPKETKVKVPPADIGGKGLQATTHLKANESHREELAITPTATWTLNQDAKPGYLDHPTEELVCPAQLAKQNEGDNLDDPLKQAQAETKNPPTLACNDEELGRVGNGKEQNLEFTIEIPEGTDTVGENCQKEVEESSPVEIASEGRNLITSESKTLDKLAKVPIPENPSSSKLNAGTQVSSLAIEQPDEGGVQSVDTYLPHSTIPKEILAERPRVNSFEGTPLGSLMEQNDKGMPKARRSQSVGQFPSTPNRQKVGQGNSKSCPPGRHKPSPSKDMVKKPSKGGKEMSILSDFFLPKGSKAPMTKYPLRRAGIPNLTVTVNDSYDDN